MSPGYRDDYSWLKRLMSRQCVVSKLREDNHVANRLIFIVTGGRRARHVNRVQRNSLTVPFKRNLTGARISLIVESGWARDNKANDSRG
jgi:hypothetical protein